MSWRDALLLAPVFFLAGSIVLSIATMLLIELIAAIVRLARWAGL